MELLVIGGDADTFDDPYPVVLGCDADFSDSPWAHQRAESRTERVL